MTYKTITIYRKYAIVHDVKINTTYNIESLTGIKFKNPTVFYTITKLKTSDYTYSTDIYFELNYPNIIFKNAGKNVNDLSLCCIFYDGGDN